jgi:hypothetical protein
MALVEGLLLTTGIALYLMNDLGAALFLVILALALIEVERA